MATKEELFAAVRLIKEHCHETNCLKDNCPLMTVCNTICGDGARCPYAWPDPEEGGREE